MNVMMVKISTLMVYAARVVSSHLYVVVRLNGNAYQFLTVALLVNLQISQQHHIQQHKSEYVTKYTQYTQLMNVLQLQTFVTEEIIQHVLIMQAHTSANVTMDIHVTAILSLLVPFLLLSTVKVVSM